MSSEIKKFWNKSCHYIKDVLRQVNTSCKVPDLTLLRDIRGNSFISSSIYDRIIAYRDEINEVESVRPKYSPLEYSIIGKIEVFSYELKHRLDPENVTDAEKRLLTLKAAFFDYARIPEALILIDQKTVQYFNYFLQTLIVEGLDKKAINQLGIDKNIEYDEKSFLEYFSSTVKAFESFYTEHGHHLPLEYFIHRVVFDLYSLKSFSHMDQYQQHSVQIRHNLVAYAYLFNVDLPADYIYINEETRTIIYIIENILRGRVNRPKHPEKVKTVSLKLVK